MALGPVRMTSAGGVTIMQRLPSAAAPARFRETEHGIHCCSFCGTRGNIAQSQIHAYLSIVYPNSGVLRSFAYRYCDLEPGGDTPEHGRYLRLDGRRHVHGRRQLVDANRRGLKLCSPRLRVGGVNGQAVRLDFIWKVQRHKGQPGS